MRKRMYQLVWNDQKEGVFFLEDAAAYLGVTTTSVFNCTKHGDRVRGRQISFSGMADLPFNRQCKECGKTIRSKEASLYCPDCRWKRMRPPKNEKKKKSKLSQIAWDARIAGMTYGDYVAHLEGKKGKVNT